MVFGNKIINRNIIKYAIDSLPQKIDIFTCSDYIEYLICKALVSPLTELKNGEILHSKNLESMDYYENELKYIIQIKPTIYWDDGTVVCAQDYVEGFRHLIKSQEFCPIINMLIPIKNWSDIICGEKKISSLGIKAVNQWCFEIELDYPMDYLPELFSTIYLSPYKYNNKTQRELYCGAFTLKNITNEKVTLKKNKYYNQISNIDEIEFLLVNDMNEALEGFRDGSIAITCNTSFPYTMVEHFRKYRNFYENRHSGLFFLLHTSNDILKKYINNLLDKDIISAKLNECISPVHSICSREKIEYGNLTDQNFSFTKQEFNLFFSNYYPNKFIAEEIKQQIEKDKKIKINLVEIPLIELSKKIDNRDYELALSITYRCINGIIPTFFNLIGIIKEDYADEILQYTDFFYKGKEFDASKVESLINDGLPFIPLFEIGSFQLISEELYGYHLDGQGIISFAGINIKQEQANEKRSKEKESCT